MELTSLKTKNGFKEAPIHLNCTETIRKISSCPPAVLVRNGFKKYGNEYPTLNNYSMTVEPGTIYGLLGASGCGKTTILSCIVGLKSLDSGTISVFGALPGSKGSGIPGRTVGYMPQDIGLYQVFTIQEILHYFGKLYGMRHEEVEARITFLAGFLDLPASTRLISSLSGGQQRRTSLAAAMIHEPKILILDEPTVGVDPLIRERVGTYFGYLNYMIDDSCGKIFPITAIFYKIFEEGGAVFWSIWKHLRQIVDKRGTTVILTTHYTEEARQSDMVGLIRSGHLLVEKPPLTLLDEHNAISLEAIVRKLCMKDNSTVVSLKNSDVIVKSLSFDVAFQPHKTETISGGYTIRGLAYRSRPSDDLPIWEQQRLEFQHETKSISKEFVDDLLGHFNKIWALNPPEVQAYFLTEFEEIEPQGILIEDLRFIFCILFIPTIQLTLVNLVLGKDIKNLWMGVVNHEFDSTDYFDDVWIRNSTSCFGTKMSYSFLNSFPQDQINWVPFLSEEEALENVKIGRTLGFITIPRNFTENMLERSVLRNFVTNETMDGSEIGIRLDLSDVIRASFLRDRLFTYYIDFLKGIASNCGVDNRSVEIPLKINSTFGTLEHGYLNFLLPSQMLLTMFVFPMANSILLVWDRKAGTLDRNVVAGVKLAHILTAFFISEGLVIFGSISLFFGMMIFVFHLKIKGSILLGFSMCFFQGITSLSFGFVMGTACTHELDIAVSAIALLTVVMHTSGAVWPLESLDGWLQLLCSGLPLTKSTEALRAIFNRGSGLQNSHVWPGFVSLSSWTIFCCFLSWAIYRNKK